MGLQKLSQRTLALSDGIAAGRAYATFLEASTRPATSQARPEPNVEPIVKEAIIGGKLVRFSPALRQRLASLAADNRARKPGGAA